MGVGLGVWRTRCSPIPAYFTFRVYSWFLWSLVHQGTEDFDAEAKTPEAKVLRSESRRHETMDRFNRNPHYSGFRVDGTNL